MTFKEDAKKIHEFFDNTEIQKIFENNFIHKEQLRKEWNKLLKQTVSLHNLKCGNCDKNIKDFIKNFI